MTTRRLDALVFACLLAGLLVAAVAIASRTYQWGPPRATTVAIELPAEIEVTGQDMEQLQRAVSAVIAYHRPGQWYILDWRAEGRTFRIVVAERPK